MELLSILKKFNLSSVFYEFVNLPFSMKDADHPWIFQVNGYGFRLPMELNISGARILVR
jgi:hypothetical protein